MTIPSTLRRLHSTLRRIHSKTPSIAFICSTTLSITAVNRTGKHRRLQSPSPTMNKDGNISFSIDQCEIKLIFISIQAIKLSILVHVVNLCES
ncbi:hypothetical protein LXL04_035397 [Taraxacum kok-saghyz]